MSMPGFWELAVLGVLALLIFGPDRLPGMLRGVGKTVGTVRREARTALDELKQASDFEDVREAAKELRDEGQALRREGQEASKALGAAMDDQPRRGGEVDGERATVDGGAAAARTGPWSDANEPAPYDPDVP